MVHHEPILGSPTRRSSPLAGSCACNRLGRRSGKNCIEIGGIASVLPEAVVFFQIALLFQIGDGPLDGGTGQLQVTGNGLDPRPALAFGIGSIPEVHIDGLGPVAEFPVRIDVTKPAHSLRPPVLKT